MPADILAANAHNIQPWIFRIEGSRIDLFVDISRNIGTIDPFRHEMHISLGCALENLLLAERANGYKYHLTLAPNQFNPRHVARVELSSHRWDISPLYRAIPNRHTNRYSYDTSRLLPHGTLEALESLEEDGDIEVFWFITKAQREKVGRLLSVFGIITVRDYDSSAQRMHLWLTNKGLAAQPMNQLHERADREAQLQIEPRFGDALKNLIGDQSWNAIFTFRLGHPTKQAPPSPRRAVRAVSMR